jgi:ankyrin repeat protein
MSRCAFWLTPSMVDSMDLEDINFKTKYGETYLTYNAALRYNDTKVMQRFLDKGADPNLTDNRGRTPLNVAAVNGRYNAIKCLLDNGADPNITDNKHMSPIMYAVLYRDVDIIKILLKSRRSKI